MTFRHAIAVLLGTALLTHSSLKGQPPGLQSRSQEVSFVRNAGQWESGIAFQGRAGQVTIALQGHGATLAVPVDSAGHVSFRALRTEFVGSAPENISGERRQEGVFNYPAKGISAGSFAQVRYSRVWHGIDLLYHADQSGFKYDFLVEPGAATAQIRLRYTYASNVCLDRSGDLIIQAPFGQLREKAPVCYQIIDGVQQSVRGRYRINSDGTIGFSLDTYVRTLPLVIDPCLSVEFATYFGGGGYDVVTSMASDSSGGIYVTGFTRSPDFPLTPAGSSLDGRNYVFVSKISSDGRRLLYSTVVGAPYDTSYYEINGSYIAYESIGADVEVTPGGEAIVAMSTALDSLPTTAGVLRSIIAPSRSGGVCPPLIFQNVDLYVARYTATGGLQWGTYLGGPDNDYLVDMALDDAGRPSIAGITYASLCGSARGDSLSFPVTPTANSFNSGTALRGLETYVSVLGADGRSLPFSALYGGSGDDVPGHIGHDREGRLLVVGSTKSDDLPTTAGAMQPARRAGGVAGSADIYVTRIDVAQSRLDYSTYICDNGAQRFGLGAIPFTYNASSPFLSGLDRQTFRQGLLVMSNGDIVIGGTTKSGGLPQVGGGFQILVHNPGAGDTAVYDAWVMRINLAAGAIVRSTYIGGSFMEGFGGLGRDRFGDIVVGLTTQSSDFPLTPINVQGDLRGKYDAAVITLSADLSTQTYGSFIGGSRGGNRHVHEQSVFGVLVDPEGGIYIYGGTNSYDLPVPSDAISRANDYYGGYIIKFAAPSAPKIGLTELALVFEPNTCADPQTRSFQLFNSGQTPMRVDSIGTTSGRYFSAAAQTPAPFTLAPCDTMTITVTFNGAAVPCRTVANDLLYVASSNAVVRRAEVPLEGSRTCVYFTVQDSTVDAEYKLGSGDKAGFEVYVYEREPAQYVTIRPDPSNRGYFKPTFPDSTRWPVGTSVIGFDVQVPDTGRYCERFTAYVEPCGRAIPLELCLWVRSGIFSGDTALDFGLISCREIEIPYLVRNVGNDSLTVHVAYVGGAHFGDIVFDVSPDRDRHLGIGDSTIYSAFLRPRGFGPRKAILVLWTNEGSREGTLKYIPITYELDSVAFALKTPPGIDIAGFGDPVELPVTYDPILEGRVGVEELTLFARFDPKVLAFDGMATTGTKMEGWVVAREQYVDSGAAIVLRVGPGGAPMVGGGSMTRLRFTALRGDTTGSPMSIALSGVSAGCFNGYVDQGRLFQLTAECAAQLRLLGRGRRTLLRPISPNPVAGSVSIGYYVPEHGKTSIILYDVNGNETARLLDDYSSAGAGEIRFDARGLAPGLYYVRIAIGKNFSETTPMVIVR